MLGNPRGVREYDGTNVRGGRSGIHERTAIVCRWHPNADSQHGQKDWVQGLRSLRAEVRDGKRKFERGPVARRDD